MDNLIYFFIFLFFYFHIQKKAKSENWEGIVIKNPVSIYENRRSRNWLKIKNIKSKDFKVNRYEVNPAGIVVYSDNLKVQISGSEAIKVKNLIDETGSCNIEVNYLEETENNKLRQPTFKCIKNGKDFF